MWIGLDLQSYFSLTQKKPLQVEIQKCKIVPCKHKVKNVSREILERNIPLHLVSIHPSHQTHHP